MHTVIQNEIKDDSSLKGLLARIENDLGGDVYKAKFIVNQYIKWLELNKKYSNENLPPNQEIDFVWHIHILDTQSYMDFCERNFGQYLHHKPSVPLSDAKKAFSNTVKCWAEHYNEKLDSCEEGNCRAMPAECQ